MQAIVLESFGLCRPFRTRIYWVVALRILETSTRKLEQERLSCVADKIGVVVPGLSCFDCDFRLFVVLATMAGDQLMSHEV